MMNMLGDKERAICEKLDWQIIEDDDDIELENYSPADEDFIFCVPAENFIEGVKEYAASFSIDEHVEMWVQARAAGNKGIPSVIELADDARAIDKMLQELAAALAEVEQ